MKKLMLAAVMAGATVTLAHAGDVTKADSAAIKQGIAEGKEVHLNGEIVQHLKDDHYLLRDTAGTIEVEIDDDLTSDQTLQNGTRLDVTGEVDHDDGRTLVEVEKVNSMQGAEPAR